MTTPDAAIEYLATTRIGEKGQLTVPKEFREDLGLGSGAPFAVLRLGDGLLLLPEQQRFDQLCEQISARLTGAGLTPAEVVATLPAARNRLYDRHYGTVGHETRVSPTAPRRGRSLRRK